MAVPLRARLFWGALGLLDRSDPTELDAAGIARARESRRQKIALPGAWLVVGRRDPGVRVEDSTARLPDGTSLPVRLYRPKLSTVTPPPVIVNFHGGGFMYGDARQSEWWSSSIASRVGAVVVSVDYRLVPEHPFPIPPEDCYAATVWVAEHAAVLGVDAARMAVMGDSAGGNLAAVVAMLARDRGGPRIALQVLVYPAVEMVEKFASEYQNANAPVLTKADVDTFSRIYLAGGDGADPRWSPLRGKHDELPPALIQTAEHDPLRDQGTAYADSLRAAGVAVRLTNYEDAVHGYISVPGLVPAARQALAEASTELRDALIGRI